MRRFFGFLALYLLAPAVSSAQTEYEFLAPLPGAQEAIESGLGLSGYLQAVFAIAVGIAGVLAVVMLVVAGIEYIGSGANESLKKAARERIGNALWGLVIAMSSWLVLYAINPDLLENSFSLTPVAFEAPDRNYEPQKPPPPIDTIIDTRPPPVTLPPPFVVTDTGLPDRGFVLEDDTDELEAVFGCFAQGVQDESCASVDFNDDGLVDIEDFTAFTALFRYDVNGDGVLEFEETPPVTSCFFKENTDPIPQPPVFVVGHNELPSLSTPHNHGGRGSDAEHPHETWSDGLPPFERQCVSEEKGDIPFGISELRGVKTVLESTGVNQAVSLESLYNELFLCGGASSLCVVRNDDMKDILFTSLAALDVSEDGVANISPAGDDSLAVKNCIGGDVSGECARADLNGDGRITDSDLWFSEFLYELVTSEESFFPIEFRLRDMEGEFFDSSGHTDAQIIAYCVGRRSFKNCGAADVNGDGRITREDVEDMRAAQKTYDVSGDKVVKLK